MIGNPPYKEKAKGRGGWVEGGTDEVAKVALLEDWMPPAEWGVGAHAKHLRNLYIYFWRWATWKVFDHDPENNTGIVCFITVAGFLNGPGFQKMRDYLRRTADASGSSTARPKAISPKCPRASSRACNSPCASCLPRVRNRKRPTTPAEVKYTVLPAGKREEKFAALAKLKLAARPGWIARRIGVLLFCRLQPAPGQLTRRWKTCSSTTARASCRAARGSSRPMRIVAAALAKAHHARSRKRKSCFIRILNRGNLATEHVDRVVSKGLPGLLRQSKARLRRNAATASAGALRISLI